MAAFALQPHVAEFLDVVMHDESLEHRMEQIEIGADSPLSGRRLGEAGLAESTGVLLLAVRAAAGRAFLANPAAETVLAPGSILIVVGTASQLDALRAIASPMAAAT